MPNECKGQKVTAKGNGVWWHPGCLAWPSSARSAQLGLRQEGEGNKFWVSSKAQRLRTDGKNFSKIPFLLFLVHCQDSGFALGTLRAYCRCSPPFQRKAAQTFDNFICKMKSKFITAHHREGWLGLGSQRHLEKCIIYAIGIYAHFLLSPWSEGGPRKSK